MTPGTPLARHRHARPFKIEYLPKQSSRSNQGMQVEQYQRRRRRCLRQQPRLIDHRLRPVSWISIGVSRCRQHRYQGVLNCQIGAEQELRQSRRCNRQLEGHGEDVVAIGHRWWWSRPVGLPALIEQVDEQSRPRCRASPSDLAHAISIDDHSQTKFEIEPSMGTRPASTSTLFSPAANEITAVSPSTGSASESVVSSASTES